MAAHGSDLRGAGAGLRTAFVSRPLEHGPGAAGEPPRTPASTSWPQTSSTWPGSWVQEARRRPARRRAAQVPGASKGARRATSSGRWAPRSRVSQGSSCRSNRRIDGAPSGVPARPRASGAPACAGRRRPSASRPARSARGAGGAARPRRAGGAASGCPCPAAGPAGEVEEGGGEVVHRDQGVTGHAGLDPRPGQHQGDAHRGLKGDALAPAPVVAQHLPVVAGVDHDGAPLSPRWRTRSRNRPIWVSMFSSMASVVLAHGVVGLQGRLVQPLAGGAGGAWRRWRWEAETGPPPSARAWRAVTSIGLWGPVKLTTRCQGCPAGKRSRRSRPLAAIQLSQ